MMRSEYFSPVSDTPGFPKALARTLLDLRLAAVSIGDLARLPRSGTDLAALLDHVDLLLNEAGASDRAALFETATRALRSPVTGWPPMPLLLLDVPFESEVEAQFLWALVQQSPQAMITVPAGDLSTVGRLESAAYESARSIRPCRTISPSWRSISSRKILRPSAGAAVSWYGFRRPERTANASRSRGGFLKKPKRGVRFDEMAIVIRSPQQYLGVLEHALARAGIPAYFDRGTRRPEPTGRAFLAMLSCAAENFSAKRFAEYLSLGQVPVARRYRQGSMPGDSAWVASRDDVFGVLSERLPDESSNGDGEDEKEQGSAGDVEGASVRGGRNPTRAMEMGKPAGGVRCDRRQRALGAAARRTGGRVRAENSRADIRAAGLAAHRASGARAAKSCASPRFRAAAHRRDVRLAKAGYLGRLDSAP